MKVYKVKPGKLNFLKEWGNFITKNEHKVKSLLRAENCEREFFYLFQIAEQWYAVIHMEGGPFSPPIQDEINTKHTKTLQECLEPEPVPLEILYDVVAD